MKRSRHRQAVAVIASVALALAPLFLPAYYTYLATELAIWGLLAISLDLLMGYTGLPSFGHAAFFGVPAYVFGIVASRSDSLGLALLAALGGRSSLARSWATLARRRAAWATSS